MNQKGFLAIQKDIYGNVISRIIDKNDYYSKEAIIYNEHNQKVSEIIRDRAGDIINTSSYEYEYDEWENVIKQVAKYKHEPYSEETSIYLFENAYDKENRLIKCKAKYAWGEEYQEIHYFYSKNILIRKEENNKVHQTYKTSYYIYDEKNILCQEKVYHTEKTLSCYFLYDYIDSNRYKRTLMNPEESKYEWKIDSMEDTTCCIIIYEVLLTAGVLKEICQFIVNQYPLITWVIIDIGNTDPDTCAEELEAISHFYNNKHHIAITFNM